MKKTQTERKLLAISIGGFFLMSVSILLMAFDSMAVLPGVCFWGGLTGGIAPQIVLEVRSRTFYASNHTKGEKMRKPRNGLLTFRSDRPAVIADIAMMVSAAAMLLSFLFTKGTGFVCYVFIAATIFTFCLHCIFNGRIYFHVKNRGKVRKVSRQKRKIRKVKEREKNENSEFSRQQTDCSGS